MMTEDTLGYDLHLCVPKTISALMRCGNRLNWRDDPAAVHLVPGATANAELKFHPDQWMGADQ